MWLPPEPISATPPALPGPAVLRQCWLDVAFVHWAVDPGAVARLFPPRTAPDVHAGRTYGGLVAFRMADVGFVRGPALPDFLETNIRLYSVDARGRRGVVFLSLDADHAAIVLAGRAVFGLPYRFARMGVRGTGAERIYAGRVRRPGGPAYRLAVRVGEQVLDGPLDRFLTARWRLHTHRVGQTWYVPNRHEPWPLRRAELIELDERLTTAAGLPGLAGRAPDHVAYSPGVRVEFGLPLRV